MTVHYHIVGKEPDGKLFSLKAPADDIRDLYHQLMQWMMSTNEHSPEGIPMYIYRCEDGQALTAATPLQDWLADVHAQLCEKGAAA